jgi:simple sugar transport system substrate-binding protein
MRRLLSLAIVAGLLGLWASLAVAADKPLVFGLLLIGPKDDKGFNQAEYEGGRYVEAKLAGARMLCRDRVNSIDNPAMRLAKVVDELVAQGATLIFAGSDDMKDAIREAAKAHPDVMFVHVSGDDVLTGKAPKNLGNVFSRMEYTQMMAGFAAAMTTQTGKIGFLGSVITDETRRLANAAFLGARYAWEKVRGKSAADLVFQVNWLGFWFAIPGETADPGKLAGFFFDQGFDVVISGIDTPQALTEAAKRRKTGAQVFALPYNYKAACQVAPDACLGVPYYNWGPVFLPIAAAVAAGTYKPDFAWLPPDFAALNDPDKSPVGFMRGEALSPEARQALDAFTADLGSGKLHLYTGPMEYQDGMVFVNPGRTATDKELWYCPQLLRGMTGASASK